MALLQEPPLYRNARTFDEIVGEHYTLLKQHYIAAVKGRNIKLLPEQQEKINQIYKELRENGMFIVGFKPDGELKLSTITIPQECVSLQIDKSKIRDCRPATTETAKKYVAAVRKMRAKMDMKKIISGNKGGYFKPE